MCDEEKCVLCEKDISEDWYFEYLNQGKIYYEGISGPINLEHDYDIAILCPECWKAFNDFLQTRLKEKEAENEN